METDSTMNHPRRELDAEDMSKIIDGATERPDAVPPDDGCRSTIQLEAQCILPVEHKGDCNYETPREILAPPPSDAAPDIKGVPDSGPPGQWGRDESRDKGSPAPLEVTEEMVEAAAKALLALEGLAWEQLTEWEVSRKVLRAALAAAQKEGDMICESHPWLPWPHGKCGGPGCPIDARDVLFRDRISGLQQAVKQRETMIADFYYAHPEDAAPLAAVKLLTLKENWDSYGAPIISKIAVDAALQLRKVLAAVPSFVPMSNGGVQIEWHSSGFDVELEIQPNGRLAHPEDAPLKDKGEFPCGCRWWIDGVRCGGHLGHGGPLQGFEYAMRPEGSPEDAPGGPYFCMVQPDVDGWLVENDLTGAIEFTGTERQCIAVRDALNCLKGDAK